MYETRAVLAGSYGRRSQLLRQGLTHTVLVCDSGDDEPLCSRVKGESIADSQASDVNAKPTCAECARKDPRFNG